MRVCWATNPIQRPTFSKLVKDFKQLRKSPGQEVVDSPHPAIQELPEITSSPSPDMRPTSLPPLVPPVDHELCERSLSSVVFVLSLLTRLKADDVLPELGDIFRTRSRRNSIDVPQPECTVSTEDMKMPEPVIYTPAPSSQSSSFIMPVESPSEEYPNVVDFDGYDSPPPADERIANIQNERRYRLLLTHDYHPSRMYILTNHLSNRGS